MLKFYVFHCYIETFSLLQDIVRGGLFCSRKQWEDGTLLHPLSLRPCTPIHAEFTVKNAKAFIQEFENMLSPDDYKLISFYVTSLFTNVPLDYTISMILKRIYDQRELETKMSRKEMDDLLLLCTKHVHFYYYSKLYSRKDGAAMGSPVGPLIPGIFMVDLEMNVIPKLSTHRTEWKRYVDDTITYIQPSSIDQILSILNSFNKNIKFTFEVEVDNKISFLDVLILKNGGSIEPTFYHKFTHKDVYLHCDSFSPNSRNVGALEILPLRALAICSNKQLLIKEIEHLQNIFITLIIIQKQLFKILFQKLKKNNPPLLLILQEVTKKMSLRVIY